MAETIIVSSINRNTEYPVYQNITAKYCCGTVKIIIDDTYTEQMLAELPNITINIYTESDGEKVLYTSRALAMAIPNNTEPIESVLIDIPTSCILALIPEFDNNAITSHNSAVCTNNEGTMWTDTTTEFPIQIIWDDTNVYAEQSGGGSGEASNVSYDNTASGITATNVQDAIDIVAEAISELEGGVHYIGEVDYYNDLPANPNLGDGYTVKYSGTSGTDLDGTEYVWAKKNNTPQWIDFSKDTYTKTEANAIFVAKVDEYNAGKTVPQGTSVTIGGTTYTVSDGAEIFNDYTNNKAIGHMSHAEGALTKAIAAFSHAEGHNTIASGQQSHAEGYGSTSSGVQSHAEGCNSTASGTQAHAEGLQTTASGTQAHAEGNLSVASAAQAHAEGMHTLAYYENQHVEGKYNIPDSTFAHIIGNGTDQMHRSNAFAIDWQGKIYTNNSATGVDVCTDLQVKIDSSHKLSADLVDDTNTTNKFATSAQLSQIATNAENITTLQQQMGDVNTILEAVL